MSLDTFYQFSVGQRELPDLIIDDTVHGKGVKARHDLQEGHVLTVIGGPTVSYAETLTMGNKESYCMQVEVNRYIRPTFPFYLFNHSCMPNCGINANLQLVTIRDVNRGEELSWDYSTSMLERGWQLTCACRTSQCRQLITDFDPLPAPLQQHSLDLGIIVPFISRYLKKNIHSKK